MTPLTTFTLSPTRHGDAVASVITRFEPSSKRTAISKLLATSHSGEPPGEPAG